MYRVTLIEGGNDICFQIDDSIALAAFLDKIFMRYVPRETEAGMTELTAEIEYMEDTRDE